MKIGKEISGDNMTRFICLTCYKTKDDTEIHWWKDIQCCERCFDKYQRLSKKDLEIKN